MGTKQILLSGRGKGENLLDIIEQYKPKSVFGFSEEPSRLWGGRPYDNFHIIKNDIIEKFQNNGVGFDLVLSNILYSEDAYNNARKYLLPKYHKDGNGVVVTNWKLAVAIRRDFPKYNIKASCIRNPRTLAAIERGLELFDQVALQSNLIKNREFIESIPLNIRDRVILFGSSSCLFNCSKPSCYPAISRQNFKVPVTGGCSGSGEPLLHRFYWFNYEEAKLFRGFETIKLVLPKGNSKIIYLDADTGNEIRR